MLILIVKGVSMSWTDYKTSYFENGLQYKLNL